MDEILKIFKNIYEIKGDNLIFEKYKFSKGTYLLVDAKRGNILEEYTVTTDNDINTKYLKELDYYSRTINTNKCLDLPARKILSNSFLCFYSKKRVIKNNLITKKNIETYKKNTILNYNSFEGDFKKTTDKDICKYIENNYSKYTIDKEAIDDIFFWIEDNINPSILRRPTKYYDTVLKVFFLIDNMENTIEFFKQEYYKYLCWNILDKEKRDYKKLEDAILEYTFYRYLIVELKKGNYYIYVTKNDIIASSKLEKIFGCKYILITRFNAKFNVEIDLIKKMDS
nr:MAG TPA: hypothetical protein [Caudoviricetes sp.]